MGTPRWNENSASWAERMTRPRIGGANPGGALLPEEHGYRIAALWVLPLILLSIVAVVSTPTRRN